MVIVVDVELAVVLERKLVSVEEVVLVELVPTDEDICVVKVDFDAAWSLVGRLVVLVWVGGLVLIVVLGLDAVDVTLVEVP